jgi:hypothetical protein
MTPAGVPHWKILRGRTVDPSPDLDTEYGWVVELAARGVQVQVTVEFARGSNLGSAAAALEALRPYLDGEEPPPRRVIVARDRTASARPL